MLEIAKELDRLGTSLRELSSNIKAFIDSSEETEATLETEESDSVKLLTVHKSKGLEFPVCDCCRYISGKGKVMVPLTYLTGEDGYIVPESNQRKKVIPLNRSCIWKRRKRIWKRKKEPFTCCLFHEPGKCLW